MNSVQHFRFIEFNQCRALRGAEAARVEVEIDGEWLWMNLKDIKSNIKEFGSHPELMRALCAYEGDAA